MTPGDTPAGIVETPSGLLVPADAADTLDQHAKLNPVPSATGDQGISAETFNRDPDGRRRIVLTREDRKALNRAIRILQAAGLGILVGCRGTCGKALVRQGGDGPDQGYGCDCSRVHFR